MKPLFFLLFIGFLCSGQESKNLVGEYASPKVNSFNLYYYGVFVKGLSLKLMEDGTYQYTTCAQISHGKWEYKNKALYLNCENIRFINDDYNHDEKYSKGTKCSVVSFNLASVNKLVQEEKIGNKKVKLILLKKAN